MKKLVYDFHSDIFGDTREETVTEAQGMQKLRELVSMLGFEWGEGDEVRGVAVKTYHDEGINKERTVRGIMTVTML